MARSLTRSLTTLAAVLLLGGWTWSAPAAASEGADRVAVQTVRPAPHDAAVNRPLRLDTGAHRLPPPRRVRPMASDPHPRLPFLRSVVLLR